jgi:hypothetical protein
VSRFTLAQGGLGRGSGEPQGIEQSQKALALTEVQADTARTEVQRSQNDLQKVRQKLGRACDEAEQCARTTKALGVAPARQGLKNKGGLGARGRPRKSPRVRAPFDDEGPIRTHGGGFTDPIKGMLSIIKAPLPGLV